MWLVYNKESAPSRRSTRRYEECCPEGAWGWVLLAPCAAGCGLAGAGYAAAEAALHLDWALLVAGAGVDGDVDDMRTAPLSCGGGALRLVALSGLARTGLATGHGDSRCSRCT